MAGGVARGETTAAWGPAAVDAGGGRSAFASLGAESSHEALAAGGRGAADDMPLLGHAADDGPPMFQLGRVQYALPAPLTHMRVCANCMVLALAPVSEPGHATGPRIVYIDLDDPMHTHEVPVPVSPQPRTARGRPAMDSGAAHMPHSLFVDPSARHVILCLAGGESYYWTPGCPRARALPRLQGLRIDSMAWGVSVPGAPAPALPALPPAPGGRRWVATAPALLGTSQGDLWELQITAQVPMQTPPPSSDLLERLTRKTAGAGAGGAGEYTGPLERVAQRVFSLAHAQPITGLTMACVPNAEEGAADMCGLVVATTCTRMYEFAGRLRAHAQAGGAAPSRAGAPSASGVWDALFQPYRDSLLTHLKTELPSDMHHSELLSVALPVLGGRRDPRRRALAWLTGAGLFRAQMALQPRPSGTAFLDHTSLAPYPDAAQRRTPDAPPPVPLSVARTALHDVLLYGDRIVCTNTLDEHVAWDEPLPLAAPDRALGTVLDESTGTCWVYSAHSIFELIVSDEDRDMWRILLRRGAFEDALVYSTSDESRSVILARQGDARLAQGMPMAAAEAYAHTSARTFEQVVLALEERGAKDAVRVYVRLRLEAHPASATTQRLMLATWLLEMYLAEMNLCEDGGGRGADGVGTGTPAALADNAKAPADGAEAPATTEETLRRAALALFHRHHTALDRDATFSLIGRHGRTDMWLAYANAIHDHSRIVQRWLRECRWADALDALGKQSSTDLYYESACTLLRHAPAETVACWMRNPALDPCRLMPALLQHRASDGEPSYSIMYLEYVTAERRSTDKVVHNTLLTLLAERAAAGAASGDAAHAAQAALQRFIEGVADDAHAVYFDLDYALRVCARHGLREACVRLYARMHHYELAVHLALEADDVDLACRCADLAAGEDAQLQKDLWLTCAKHVIKSEHGVERSMAFLARTELITIEDVLPYFPDFVVIDQFKDEICHTLDAYVARIDELKEELGRTTETAEHIQHDIQQLADRVLPVAADQPCALCAQPLLQRPMYIFSCCHGFHVDCLTAEVTQHLQPRRLRRLVQIQDELAALTSGEPAGTQGDAASKAALSLGSSLKLDRLREHVSPQAIVDAISTGFSAGRRAFAPLGAPADAPVRHASRAAANEPLPSARDAAKMDALRSELNAIVAGTCTVCTLPVQQLAMPFTTGDDTRVGDDWAV
ncbi:hypothetical protein MSPP1_002655 [Malassezia sp. CBS 17886]|nr:hypothetical protein MSPP1_002655 [Malassezia sp. CBS 17886]